MDYKVQLKNQGVSEEHLAALSAMSSIDWKFLSELATKYGQQIVEEFVKVLNHNA